MGRYIDGFVIPVPKDRIDDYRRVAEKAALVWKEYGALDYWECVGDDLAVQDMVSFSQLAQAGPDETVVFAHLEKTQLRDIVLQYVGKLSNMLRDRDLSLVLDPDAIDLLVERGYDRDFGARPMKRVFQRDIQNPMAVEILSGKYPPGTQIEVSVKQGEFAFSPVSKASAAKQVTR